MIPNSYLESGLVQPSLSKRKALSGFSLIEVLMCLTLIALIMLPFTLLTSQTAQIARGSYLQSTRSILLNSLKAESATGMPTYATTYTDSSMNTGVTESGQTIPTMRVVDTTGTNSNSMKRTTHYYIYNDSGDATSAPRYQATVITYPKTLRMRWGNSGDTIDANNRYWYGNGANLYSTTNKVPGMVSGYSATSYGNNILNTSGNDDGLYQKEQTSGNMYFSADVENGYYTVKILACETYGSVNATNDRRTMNIYLEGIKVNTNGPYSAFESTGGANLAEVLMYDVNVTDGVLNFRCAIDGSSSNDPNCNFRGIIIKKRTLQ